MLPCLLAGLAAANGAGAAQAETRADTKVDMQAAARTAYRVINLGTGDLSELPVINGKGQVSFSIQAGAGSRGFFYNGKATVDIGTLGGPSTNAVDVNDAGQVTGRSTLPSGLEHAFVWRSGSGMIDLGVLPGAANSAAAAINNRGVVVGISEGAPATPPRAFRWSAADGMEDLGAFTSGLASFSSATALNDAGLIAGNSDTAALTRDAFVWTRAGGMVDISAPGSGDAFPVAVGARGQVAGGFAGPGTGFLYHAFLWTRATGMVDLGTEGGTESGVTAMSPDAHVVGVINFGTDRQHAMSWTRATGMVDLGTLGGQQSRALGVNGKGQVVGSADDASGNSRAFLWTAKQGMVDLNRRLRHAPKSLRLDAALAINDNGAIVASSNAGLVLLKPGQGREGTHALGPVEAADMVKVGASLNVSVGFADEDLVGTRGITWSWGDGSGEQAGKVSESGGAGNASASHTYAAPGIYALRATVVNAAGSSAAVSRKVIVYEPSGGVVAGSGSFVSPEGAIRTAPERAARAFFSFFVPLNMRAQVAGTRAQLHFDVPGLSLRSASLKPVALKGTEGQFEGSGTVNGAGDYKFTLSTVAGAATGPGERARFGLKIWHADPATRKEVVDYDNPAARQGVAGGALVEGRILQE